MTIILRRLLFIYLLSFQTILVAKELIVQGTVIDKKGNSIVGANVYIEGSIEGASSGEKGEFLFQANKEQEFFKLVVSAIGYERYEKGYGTESFPDSLIIVLTEEELQLDEVIVSASTFSIGGSRTLDALDPLDIVMQGSSVGDIYAALNTLPGTQTVGESGKLYIRGGDENEAQTFIDGMHVLVPYTNSGLNIPSRGRFSPFLFQGINFSLGGYEVEYGQALSSVLPMETKDVSLVSKMGITASPLNWGIGGTYSKNESSISANISYTDLEHYNKIFPDSYNWGQPYYNQSGEAQFKTKLKEGIFKTYLSYSKEGFVQNNIDTLNSKNLDFGMNQNNYYLNSTYQWETKNNLKMKAGVAYSNLQNRYSEVIEKKDQFEESKDELHLKFVMDKRLKDCYVVNVGTESYWRNSTYNYKSDSPISSKNHLDYKIWTIFANNQIRLKKNLYTNLGGRATYIDYTQKVNFTPRISLDYNGKDFNVSAIWGTYNQMPVDSVLGSSLIDNVKQEKSTHFILGGGYRFHDRLLRVEFYHKKYHDLHLFDGTTYNYNGYGKSSGVDVYWKDEKLLKNLKYTISYSYNDASRLYGYFTKSSKLSFNSKHNANVSLVYYFPKIKTYWGLSNTYAGGRPYSNKNLNNEINSETRYYNSLDLNMTVLLHPKVIIYSSLTNILGRNNVFGYQYANLPDDLGYYKEQPLYGSRKRFFYVALFFSIFNNNAYDVSNF